MKISIYIDYMFIETAVINSKGWCLPISKEMVRAYNDNSGIEL